MSGPLSSMLMMSYGHSSTGPCGCRIGLPLLCITSSMSRMTCSIIWMVWCERSPRSRHNGTKTYTLPWRLHGRSCPNIIPIWILRLVCVWLRHIFLIVFGSFDHLGSGTREWILILKTRLLILHNTWRPLWCIRRKNTALNTDICRWLNLKAFRTTITSPPQLLLNLVNLLMIHIMCPAIMKNTWHLTMWPKQHPDKAMVQHACWQPHGSTWIHLLYDHSTDGKLIQILTITTLTQWRLLVHFGYQILPTGGGSKKKSSQSTPISPMWHAIYSLSYLTASEWRLVIPLGKIVVTNLSRQ